MADDMDFLRELFVCCKPKERKYKTFIVKDSSTNLYRVAKAEDVEKRFKVLSASNENLSIELVIDKNVKSKILKQFGTSANGSEWFKLNDGDIREIKEKYSE